jgi:hypothetical protein
MKALNRQQRKGAILKFIILYAVTILFIIIPFIFLGDFIDQQNKNLNKEIGSVRGELEACRKGSKIPRGWDTNVKEYYGEYYNIEQSLRVIKDEMYGSVETELDKWTPALQDHFIKLIVDLRDVHSRLEIQNQALKESISN